MQSYSIISTKQIISNAILISICFTVFLFFAFEIKEYMDLPDVHIDSSGKCVKVENFKNGDSYACQDVKVVLKK